MELCCLSAVRLNGGVRFHVFNAVCVCVCVRVWVYMFIVQTPLCCFRLYENNIDKSHILFEHILTRTIFCTLH